MGLLTAAKGLVKNPKVLMGASWVLAAGAVVTAALVTPKAMRAYDQLADEQFEVGGEKYFNSPKAKAERTVRVGKHYILSAVLLGGSMLTGGASVKILTAGLNSSTSALMCYEKLHKAYVEHNKEILGEEKEREFRSDAYRPRELPDESGVTHTPYGNTLFKVEWDDTWFRSSAQAVDKGVLMTNDSMLSDHFMSLNELYMNWGLKSKPSGENVGWWIDTDGLVSIDRDYVEMDDGTVVGIITFGVDPISRYTDRDCR